MSTFKFNRALSLLLAFQLTVTPFARAGETSAPPPLPNSSEEPHLSPEQQDIENEAKKLESDAPLESQDPYLVGGQRAEIVDEQGTVRAIIPLDRGAIARNRPAVTTVRPKIGEDGSLVLEGYRGEDEKGQNGILVARQVIPKIRPVSVNLESARDRELLMIVDENGSVHAIDWGFVNVHSFESPILVFQNLHQGTGTKLSAATTQTEFWTVGRKPFTEEQIAPGAIVPRDPETGVLQLEAGDLIVSTQQGPEKTILGIYSRRVTHKQIADASEVIDAMYDMLKGDSKFQEAATAALRENEDAYNAFLADLEKVSSAASNPAVAELFRAIPDNAAATLRRRIADHRGYAQRQVDTDTLEGWVKTYDAVRAKLDVSEEDPASAEKMARNWQEGFNKNYPDHHEPDLNKWLTIALASYMVTGVTLGSVESLQQINFLGWAYAHLFPAILKDSLYRWPLLVSTMSLAAIWPAAVGISMASGKVLSALSSSLSNSTSKFASRIKDIARNWVPLNNWRRITSMSLRVYSYLILGVWITAIEKVGGQKTFFLASNLDINPFKQITPDSDVGQKLGLNESTRVGLVNPLLRLTDKDEYNRRVEQKIGALTELKARQDRKRVQAWLMAAGAVAEQYGIDMGTLLMLEKNQFPSKENLKALLENPKAAEEWELLSADIYRQIRTLSLTKDVDGDEQVDIEALAEQYRLAQVKAEQLTKLDPTGKLLKTLRNKAGRGAVAFKHWFINLGRGPFDFLQSIYTNQKVTDQVRREFLSDHLLMVFQTALVGARADLNHPNALAADPNGFLMVRPAHWTDVSMNANIHFFFQGARQALMYQRLKAEDETNYTPRENLQYQTEPKAEAFWPGIARFGRNLSPDKSDLGGFLIATWKRQFQTLQASFAFPFFSRVLPPASQPAEQAMFATLISWSIQFYYFFAPNLIVNAVSMVTMNEFEGINQELNAARTLLGQSLREPNPTKAVQLKLDGLGKMFAIYEKHNPKLLNELEAKGDDIEAVLQFSVEKPPAATAPNPWVLDLMPWLAGLANVYLATKLSVTLWDPANLNITSLAEYAATSAFLTAAVYLGLGKKPWEFYLNPGPTVEKIRDLFKEKPTSCEQRLVKTESSQELQTTR